MHLKSKRTTSISNNFNQQFENNFQLHCEITADKTKT